MYLPVLCIYGRTQSDKQFFCSYIPIYNKLTMYVCQAAEIIVVAAQIRYNWGIAQSGHTKGAKKFM